MPRQGILKFNPSDLKSVVTSVMEAASKCVPPRCGAAFLLFMALRHTDATNDDALLKVTYFTFAFSEFFKNLISYLVRYIFYKIFHVKLLVSLV